MGNPRAGQSAGAENNIRNSPSVQPSTVNSRPWPRDRLRDAPHDLDTERAVLACVLYGNVLPSSLDLTGTDFYSPDHEALWNVLEAMENDGRNIDAITADSRLNAAVERLADPALVPSLAGGTEIPGNAGTYAGMIREESRRRHALAFLRQAVQRLVQGDDPAEVLDPTQLDRLRTGARRTGSRLGKLVDPAQVKAVRREWIKRDWYPCDVVTILAGHGGEGKSTFSLADVAAGSRGELHGRRWGRPVRSLIVATEDTASDQKLRLKAAGANLEHVRFFTVTDPRGEELHFNLELDLAELRTAAQHFGADLLVIDPLSSVTSGLDLNKAADMRKALDPLTMLARQLHVAVLVIHHFNKGGGNASRKMTGSEAIRDIARSVIHFAHDKESDERVLTFDKGNYSTYEGRSFNFELESAPAIDDAGNQMIDEEGNLETVPVARLIGETDNSVERIINSLPQGQEEGDAQDCASWLREWAESVGGVLEAAEVRKASESAGFSWSAAKRAKSKLRMTSDRDGFGKGSKVYWRIPEAATDHHRAHIEPIEPSSPDVIPMGPMAVPMVSPTSEPEPPASPVDPVRTLDLVPDDPCGFCGKSLTGNPGQKRCAAKHRRAREAAS